MIEFLLLCIPLWLGMYCVYYAVAFRNPRVEHRVLALLIALICWIGTLVYIGTN